MNHRLAAILAAHDRPLRSVDPLAAIICLNGNDALLRKYEVGVTNPAQRLRGNRVGLASAEFHVGHVGSLS